MASGRLPAPARLAVRAEDLNSARDFALSLPEAREAPHFDMSPLRVDGKIVATVPPDLGHLNALADDSEVPACVAESLAAIRDSLRLVV